MIEDKKHSNQRCFIIGGGESIKTLEEKGLNVKRLLENEITIGTNKSYLLGKSSYHVVMDKDYFVTDRENLLKQNLFVSDNIWNNCPDLRLRPIRRLNSKTSKIISNSFNEGLYYGRSTGYLAMNLANVLGCNPIYLLGIDLKGFHFHEGYGKEKDQTLPKEHKVIEKELRSGIKYLQNLGVKVISLSDISSLNDIIPYNPAILKLYGWTAGLGMKDVIGKEWKDPKINEKLEEKGLEPDHKYRRREEWIDNNKKMISQLLSEYEYGKPKEVIDFSTGNGTFLEVMRYLGHTIQGTDSPSCKYTPFTDSQDVPVSYFNASCPPYPFPDKSFDLVNCTHAMNFYKCDWNLVLDEFFRISRETVFVIVNLGDMWNLRKHFFDNYKAPKGWVLKYKIRSTFKWVYEG
jgi:hypothetical protein